jgi:hypothetical protein
MTIHHLNKRDWKHIVDYETFWVTAQVGRQR